jgi:ABC-type transport system substrate-binding protein
MRTKEIFAIAMLGLMIVSTFAIVQPVVVASDQSIFKITMIAPGSANLLRRQWGLIIANSFQSVGIDARMVFMGWGSVYDRCLTPAPEMIGKTYDEGGFDALFIGWTPGAPSTPFAGTFQIYYSMNTPPNSNYFLWNNATSDLLLETMLTKGYTAEGIQAFKDWQLVQYQDLPASQICLQEAIFTADSALDFHGFEWIFDNIGPVPQFLTGRTDAVLGTTGELLALNPPLSNSWYDTLAFSPLFDGLYYLDTDYSFQPAVAAALPVVSADGSEYTITLKQGVKWHDGVEVTADDVVFTWLAYLNPQSGSLQSAFTAGYIGDDITFKWLNGTTTRLVIDLVEGVGYYPATTETGTRIGSVEAVDTYTVKCTIADFGALGKPAATFFPEGVPGYLLPKHVLEAVPFADWLNDPFNLGTGTYTVNGQTFSGPIGCGPYKYVSYDPTRAIVTTEKFDDYWNKTGLESIGQFVVQNYYVRYIVEKDSAIAALKNGEVHIIDQNYQLQRDYTAGNLDFATSYLLAGSGLQQLGYNMEDPIWGTGTATPLGQSDPSRAAEAARYVRTAFDYLIPRELIIDNLLSGFAEPGAVHVNPLSPYKNTECVAREYDPAMAKEYLAMAGYKVGVTPGGPTAAVTNYFVNEPIILTGQFIIDTVAAVEQGGIVALLKMSTDNATFTPVAQTVTTTGGYYQLAYTPTTAGTLYFRVALTGVGALTASQSLATGPTFPYSDITTSVDPQTTPTVQVTVVSVDDAIATYTSQVTTLTSQVSSLNAQVASLTNIAYAGVIIAILAILVAAVFGMRKK